MTGVSGVMLCKGTSGLDGTRMLDVDSATMNRLPVDLNVVAEPSLVALGNTSRAS
jgi:hypothetical protein